MNSEIWLQARSYCLAYLESSTRPDQQNPSVDCSCCYPIEQQARFYYLACPEPLHLNSVQLMIRQIRQLEIRWIPTWFVRGLIAPLP